MDWFSLGLAIVTASLIGSGHCVGMCGPFALLASQTEQQRPFGKLLATFSYHFGRLFTYLILGVIAGSAGALLDSGGNLLGLQRIGAWITGIMMIGYGIFSLVRLSRFANVHFSLPQAIGNWVQKAYRISNRFSGAMKSMAIGSITAWLPCGWLYAFVLIALGTSSAISGAAVMAIFWLGTVPMLSVFALGVVLLSERWKKLLPYATAVLLIISGFSSVTVRAHAMFDSLEAKVKTDKVSAQSIGSLTEEPMPCCHCQKDCE